MTYSLHSSFYSLFTVSSVAGLSCRATRCIGVFRFVIDRIKTEIITLQKAVLLPADAFALARHRKYKTLLSVCSGSFSFTRDSYQIPTLAAVVNLF